MNKTIELKQKDLLAFTREWDSKMIEIWKDRMELSGAIDTKSLYNSLEKGRLTQNDFSMELDFKFLLYGIYVDLGVGSGYKHDNGGNLEFLNSTYRYEHHLGNVRKREQWFNKSWAISVDVLKEKFAQTIGDEFSALFDNLTERERG